MKDVIVFAVAVVIIYKVVTFVLVTLDTLNSCGILEYCK